jgi:hypothetical protein
MENNFDQKGKRGEPFPIYEEEDPEDFQIDPIIQGYVTNEIKLSTEATQGEIKKSRREYRTKINELSDRIDARMSELDGKLNEIAQLIAKGFQEKGSQADKEHKHKKKGKDKGNWTICLEEAGVERFSSRSSSEGSSRASPGSSSDSERDSNVEPLARQGRMQRDVRGKYTAEKGSRHPRVRQDRENDDGSSAELSHDANASAVGKDRRGDKTPRGAREHRGYVEQRRKKRDKSPISSDEDDSSEQESSDQQRKAKKSKQQQYKRASFSQKGRVNPQREGTVQIHYKQAQPESFNLKLDSLTVQSAVIFLEKYNELKRDHYEIRHISRFISKGVELELLANARKR